MSTTEVWLFKTAQGIDLIGRLKEDTGTTYIIEDVLAVAMQNDQRGNVSVGLMPAVHPGIGKVDNKKNGAIKELRLPRTSVMFPFEPTKEISDYYVKAVSGIELVKNMPSNMSGPRN